jgi:FkbM family methyltransferase
MSAKRILKKIVNILPMPLKNKAYKASAIIFGLSNLNSLPVYNIYHHISNLKKLGFNPDLVIDVGALFGEWTENVRQIFPEANFIMVEPQVAQKPYLEGMTRKFSNVSVELTLVGDEEKEDVDFYIMGSGSSIYQENTDCHREKVSLRMQTIETLIRTKYASPQKCFIKLDVQGAEIDVLKGAAQLLQKTEFILLEISTLNYNYRAPQFADVVIFMKEQGFVLFDICDERRMKNEVLYQTDMIFARESSAVRKAIDFKDDERK